MTGNRNGSKGNTFGMEKNSGIKSKKAVFILSIIVSLTIGVTGGFLIKRCGKETSVIPQEVAEESSEKILFWTCSMHPQIKQNGPGRCPICSMDLIPMKEDARDGDKASLTLGKRARQLASIKTTPVVYKKLTKSIYTVGKIDYDESKVSYVTAWIGGRIDKLYVNFTGTIVQKGEHLVYIYSPELVSTQDEYLIAYKRIKTLERSTVPEIAIGSGSLLRNTRDRLLLWGVTEDQIKDLEKTQKVQTHLTIYAPIGGTVIHKNVFEGMYVNLGDRLFTIADLSRLWLYLDIYEYDIPWIRYGQDVEVTTESFPGTVFHGTVVFIDPFIDEATRTVRVRVNMDNRERKLKPGMYTNARLKVQLGGGGVILDSDIEGKYMCPMHPDSLSDEPGDCPECGMHLELVGSRPGLLISGLIPPLYECPNKCPVSISSMPGDCPNCGTNLVKKQGRLEEEKSNNEEGVLAVPHSAVLYTGLRNIVYVEKEDGNYTPRDIKLGPKADDYYHVISGLKPNERVVTSGNFLIDSQMQLLGKPSLLFPEGSEIKENKQAKEEKSEIITSETLIVPQFRNLMSKIMDDYFSIRTKLANDSIEGIENKISSMEEKVKSIEENNFDFPEDAHKELTELFSHMGSHLDGMKGKSLEETRDAFKVVSKYLSGYVNGFHYKIKDPGTVYLFFCPMADASWMQENSEIGNPYFGSKMLKCGTLEKEIP